ncbi:ABC transporter ATP-binding protein [Fictibacillus fluitans]|uniref:Dipeptide ABC transporter ATP-binding protein n=1 Tax=Fictibacillus fluitans TaxID=3058422 RepID=A0ABT8HTJ2_9BACL|nr:dipeptide ABC transporter ATP-binding protein [Fictibacillus sp. NE201]MDN4524044.1 dipeptide ABC transporter ATP-binding protein [Fictibacillus sp. NE201]
MKTKLLEVKDLEKRFKLKKAVFAPPSFVHAINGVNLVLHEGETLGIVGESGCGKSTTGRCLLRLIEPSHGEVIFEGKDITHFTKSELKAFRKQVQMVFQDPMDSMNPKMTIGEIMAEPLISHKIPKAQWQELLTSTIKLVGLNEDHLSRYPHEFSGGQKQRIGIARAIILRPKVIVADEPVSALDVSVQSQIINLLQDLQEELDLSYVFISHDLGVVEHIAHRVAVMYLGEVVELADSEELFRDPLHPYTKALISSIPRKDPDERKERIILKGEIPSPSSPPAGCKFHPRCEFAAEICKTKRPALKQVYGREVACHLY